VSATTGTAAGRRGRTWAAIAAAACASVAACGPAEPAKIAPAPHRRAPPGPVHHVVLVTIDGLLPDAYLHPDAHGLAVPTLRRLVAEGAASDGALSVFPTLTYPSHTTMATGFLPVHHGITTNLSFDPYEIDQGGWRWYAEDIRRDPLWRVVERAGYPAAVVHWPVSAGAQVTWRVPEYWRAKDDNDKKLLRALSTPGLLDDVARTHPSFWDRYTPPNVRDDALTDIATHVLAAGKPALLMLHLVEVDGAQHATGTWSKESVAAIENDDRQLARILKQLDDSGLRGDTSLVVASDHGFADTTAMVRPGVLLREAGLVTVAENGRVTDWKATVVTSSGQAYVYVRSASDAATAKAARDLFEAKAKDAKSGIGRLYDAGAIRELGGDPAAAFAVEAAPGFQFGPGAAGDYVAPPMYKATHGYDPSRPEMRASLIVSGPNVPHGSLPGARLVDVAPTVASWLGLSLGETDGKPLRVVPAGR